MESIILAKNIQANKISFGDLKTSDSGAKNIFINYDGKPLYAQTPEMSCVYGLSKWNMDGKVPDKYSMELSFQGATETNSLGKFMHVLKNLNNKFIDQAMTKGPEWFRKKFSSPEVVEAIYTPLIKYPKDKETGEVTDKFAPTFRINIPFKDDKVACPVYDSDKNELNLFDIETKGAKITAIIRFSGLWIAGGKFGVTCKVEQLRVIAPKTIKGFAFQDNDDEKIAGDLESDVEDAPFDEHEQEVDESEITEAPEAPEPNTSIAEATQSIKDVHIDDSEDEDELEKPKIIKTVVRKKKTEK
jgi:hypothetical protein